MGAYLSIGSSRQTSTETLSSDSQSIPESVTSSYVDTKLLEGNVEEHISSNELSKSSIENPSGIVKDEELDDNRSDQSFEEDRKILPDSRHDENEKKMAIFKQELASKREARHKAIAALTEKMKNLESQVSAEEEKRINAENEVIRLKKLLEENELKDELEKEKSKVEILVEQLENEKRKRLELENEKENIEDKKHQIRALKEVASIGREMLRIRELQVNELKKKLYETQYPEDLREEYELQLENVKRLKVLYEERAEAVRIEHRREIEREVARIQVLETKINELERERNEAQVLREHLKERVLKLDQELEERTDAAMSLQEQLDASVVECRDLASQMNLINNLFSQMLVGNLNLDRITRLVEENQSLVVDLTTDDRKNDLAALLIDLAKQLDENIPTTDDQTEFQTQTIENEENQTNVNDNLNLNNNSLTQQELVVNLSKVWRMLVQLLMQDQTTPAPSSSECDSECCYKSVETPSGKQSVISVSQTFLTLKNLILEKNSLIKEVNKLKLLNEHLETRLGSQEKRLSTVSTELKKTWGVVSKLRSQHKQLHTQEKIIKYELQHKRSLLNELKDELERCKEIWDMARKKNFQSEEDWRKLRKEFADRRNNTDISNSAESGYEDEDSNTPPTDESIEEPELAPLINTETDTFLLNEEAPASTPDLISNIEFTEDDQQNDSDDTIENIDPKQIPKETLSENGNYSNNTELTILNECPSKKDDEEKSYNIVPCSSESNGDQSAIPLDINPSSFKECSFKNHELQLNLPEELSLRISESNQNPLIKDTRPNECEEFHNTSSSKEENISKFLEGLLVSDDGLTKDKENSDPEKHHKSLYPIEEIVGFCSSINQQTNIMERNSNQTPVEHETMMKPSKRNDEIDESDKFDEACGFSPAYFEQNRLTKQLHSINDVLDQNCSTHESTSTASKTVDCTKSNHTRTTEEVLDARTERLKRLEEQCKSLFHKVTATTIKSNVLSSKLELLHEQYGRSENIDDYDISTNLPIRETIDDEKINNKTDDV